MTDQEKQRVRDAIARRLEDYRTAVIRLDLQACLDCWARNEEPVSAGDGKLMVGWEAHVAYYNEGLAHAVKVNSFQFTSVHVHPLSSDAAACAAEFAWSMQMDDGSTVNSTGAWTYSFKREGDTWRIVQSGGTHLYS
ncbi:MAG TPA: nuclear transport factor 2 family protein [Gemmatimonadales bacterium]